MLEKIISLSNKSLSNLIQNKKQELIYSCLLELLEHKITTLNLNDKKRVEDIIKLRNLIENFANTSKIELIALNALAKKRSFFTLLNIELTHTSLLYEDAWLSFKSLLLNAIYFLIAYYIYIRIVENINTNDIIQNSDEEYNEWQTKKKDLIWNCCFHNNYDNNPYLEPFLLANLTKNNKGLYSYWTTYMQDTDDFIENINLLKKTIESIAPNEYSEFLKFKKQMIKENTEKMNNIQQEIKKEEMKNNANVENQKENLVEINKKTPTLDYRIQEHKKETIEKQTFHELVENKTNGIDDIIKVVNPISEVAEQEKLTFILNKIKTEIILAGYSVLSKEVINYQKLELNIEIISNLLSNNNLNFIEIKDDKDNYLIAYKASNILNDLEELIKINQYMRLVTFSEAKFVVIAYMLENQIIRKATFENQAIIVLSKIIESALNNNVVVELVFYDNDILLSLTDKLNEKDIMFSMFDNEDSISLIINGENEQKINKDANLVYRIDFNEADKTYYIIDERNNQLMYNSVEEKEIIKEFLRLLQNSDDVVKLIISAPKQKLDRLTSEFEKQVNSNGNIFFSKLNESNALAYYIYNIGLAIDKLKTDINKEIKNNINFQILNSINVYDNYVNKRETSHYFNNLIQTFSLLNKYNESKKFMIVRDHFDNKTNEISNAKKIEVFKIDEKTNEKLLEEKNNDISAIEENNIIEIPAQADTKKENKNDIENKTLPTSTSHIPENESIIDKKSINFEEQLNKQDIIFNTRNPIEEKIFEPQKQTLKTEKKLEVDFSNIDNKTVEKNAINDTVIDNIIDSVMDTSTKKDDKENYVDIAKTEEKIIDVDNKKTEIKLDTNAEFLTLNKTEKKESETSDSLIDRLIEEITKEYKNEKSDSNKTIEPLQSLEPEEKKMISNSSPNETTINKSSIMAETDIISNYQEDQKTNLITTTTSLLDNELKKLESLEKSTKESINIATEIKTNLEELNKNQKEIIESKEIVDEQKKVQDSEKKDIANNRIIELEQNKENIITSDNYVITHVDKKIRPQIIGQLNYFYNDNDCIVDIRKSADGKIYRLTLNIKDLVLNGDYKKEDLEHLFKIHVDDINYFWNLSNNKLFLDDLNCEINPKTFLIGMPNSKYVSEYSIDNIAEDAFYFYSALLMLANDLLNSTNEELKELIESSNSNVQVTEIKPIVEDLLHRVFKRIFNP